MDKDVLHKETVSLAAVRGAFLMAMAIFLIGLVYVGYRGDQGDEHITENAERIAVNQARIDKNTAELKVLVQAQCVESQTTANSVNEVLDTLIQGAVESTAFSPTEKAARLARYRAAKVKIPVCAN